MRRKLFIAKRFLPASLLLYLSLGLSATAVLATDNDAKGAPPMKDAASPAAPSVSTASPLPNSLSPPAPVVPQLDCLIEPYMTVELATTVSGIVKVVNVDRGDIVKAGQVLAQLEAEVEKANVARERARAEFAAKKSHRMQELLKEQMVSAQQAEEAKADSDLAAAELKKAVEMLNQRTVFSPFNGVVVDRYVSPGELVENKKILKVAQINPLSVEVIAPIAMLGEFKPGAKMRVLPEGPAAGPFDASVRLVDRVIDAPSGTFRVRLALPNPRHQISAGVRCKAQLVKPAPEPTKSAVTKKAKVPSAEGQKNQAGRKLEAPKPEVPASDTLEKGRSAEDNSKIETQKTETGKADAAQADLAGRSASGEDSMDGASSGIEPMRGASKGDVPGAGNPGDGASRHEPAVEAVQADSAGSTVTGMTPASDTSKIETNGDTIPPKVEASAPVNDEMRQDESLSKAEPEAVSGPDASPGTDTSGREKRTNDAPVTQNVGTLPDTPKAAP